MTNELELTTELEVEVAEFYLAATRRRMFTMETLGFDVFCKNNIYIYIHTYIRLHYIYICIYIYITLHTDICICMGYAVIKNYGSSQLVSGMGCIGMDRIWLT